MSTASLTVATRTERISAPDDSGIFDAHLALPATGSGPGILVIQEISGVNTTSARAAPTWPGSAMSPWHRTSSGASSHFGDEGPYIPTDKVAQVRDFAANMSAIECRVHPGGHAFDNEFNPMFAAPLAQAAAWSDTEAFLAAHLPTA